MSDGKQQQVKMTVKELVEHFEGFMSSLEDKGEQTQGTYRRALREFLRWFPRDRRFRFTTRDVERYKRYLAETRELKPVSVATYLTALRRFCQYLIDVKVLMENPASDVIGGRRPTTHSREFLTYEEIDRLLSAIDTDTTQGLRDKSIVMLMLYTALSEQECVHALVGDIRLLSDGTRRLDVLGKGKNAKDRSVELPGHVWNVLDAYLKRRYGGEETLESDPLFPSLSNRSHGKQMTPRGMRETVNRWLKESGVKGDRDRRLTPFSLRHTAGIMMVDQGATLEEIMERMRIDWKPTAQIYLRLRGSLGTIGPME